MIIDRILRPRDLADEAYRADPAAGIPGGTALSFMLVVFALLPLLSAWNSVPALVGFLLLLLAGFLVDRYVVLPRAGYIVIRVLAWLPVAYVFAGIYWLDDAIFAVIGNVLAAWVLLYSFEANRRGYLQPMLMMCGMVLIVSSLLRRDGVLLLGFIVYGTLFLPVTAHGAARAAARVRRAQVQRGSLADQALLVTAGLGLMLAAMLGGTALFVFMPRLNSDLLRSVGASNIYQTALPVFRIGNGSRPLDWRPVMRIRSGRPGNYRGQAFVFYTGMTWSAIASTGARELRPQEGTVTVPQPVSEAWHGRTATVHQEFRILPGFSTNIRYALLAPQAVRTDDAALKILPDGQLAALMRTNFSYTAVSQVPVLVPGQRGSAELPLVRRGMYLQLPSRSSRRVAELAQRVAGTGGSDVQRVQRLSDWLQENCTYDLTASTPLAGYPDMLEYFLFESRAGWCEHFATALAVLCRHAGLPSRLITGFAPGEYDPADRSWLVRALHAHAWTEVWIDGQGWMDFDATPPGAFPSGPESFLGDESWTTTLPARILSFIDADQSRLQGMVLEVVPVPDIIGGGVLSLGIVPLLILMLAIVALVVLLVGWRRRGAGAVVPLLVKRMNALRSALVQAGARDAAGWTVREFAAQEAPAALRAVFAELQPLVAEYYRCRFAPADAAAVHALAASLTRLRNMLR